MLSLDIPKRSKSRNKEVYSPECASPGYIKPDEKSESEEEFYSCDSSDSASDSDDEGNAKRFKPVR